MFVYCLYLDVADEYVEYYITHSEKYSKEQLKEHYIKAKANTKDKSSVDEIIKSIIEMYGYQELEVEMNLDIWKVESE